ncbi:hypothetical protein L5515_019630 [Caenorhabditis briggsae]|uniref:Protein kinase domain-containing protein n=1 Tax=Caenorhabditis briggsae TaxID=6238 RepID=A0AAE9JUB6_CAEBR|nr:hypothetical protein L5515_019630 [Caenorhabditis briggsae]
MISNPAMAIKLGYNWRWNLKNGGFGNVSVVDKKIEDREKRVFVMKRVSASTRYEMEFDIHRFVFGYGREAGSDHIIEMFAMYVAGTEAVFIIDFADQGDLGSRCTLPLHPSLAQNYFRQSIWGLDFIHKKNVVHRDIKLLNLFLKSPNKLKIGDFGMAERYRTDCGKQIWLKGRQGTRTHLAPELFISGMESKGPPLDVWAAGIVLVELLTMLWKQADLNDKNFVKYFDDKYKNMEFEWKSLGMAKKLVQKLLKVQSAFRITIEDIIKDPWFVTDIPEEDEFEIAMRGRDTFV